MEISLIDSVPVEETLIFEEKKFIYIGAIDPKLERGDIIEYFTENNLRVSFLPNKKKRSKNYIVVSTKDPKTYDFLTLVKKIHKVKGLKFTTDEYLTGKDKVKKDADEAKRKIYVGNLPPGTLANEIKDFFSRFGLIQTAYISSKNNINSGENFRNTEDQFYFFAFVIFENEKSAINATNVELLNFKNHKISVKPFKLKWTRHLKKKNKKVSFDRNDFYLKDEKHIPDQDKQFHHNFKKDSLSYNEANLLRYIYIDHRVNSGNIVLNKFENFITSFFLRKKYGGSFGF